MKPYVECMVVKGVGLLTYNILKSMLAEISQMHVAVQDLHYHLSRAVDWSTI